MNWGIFQPTQKNLIDFSGVNHHTDTELGRNGISQEWAESGNDENGEISISGTWSMEIEDFGLGDVYVDFACSERSSEWGIGVGSGILVVTDSAGAMVSEGVCQNSCLLYTSPSPRDKRQSRMPSSA